MNELDIKKETNKQTYIFISICINKEKLKNYNSKNYNREKQLLSSSW